MNSNNNFKPTIFKIFLLFIIFSGFLVFTGFFSLYQSGNIKNDGSGSLNIVYSGTIKEVVDNGYSLGNFPFGENNIRNCFSSENVSIKKLQIAKPGDTAYMVILDLEFKNISDLNKLKGFADISANLSKIEDGTEFKWIIKSNERTKFLDVINFTLSFESEIVSSNGIVKDGTVKWHKTDFSQENVLSVILKSELPVSENSGSANNTVKDAGKKDEIKKDNGKEETENMQKDTKKKTCGLWGVELPLILLTGYGFSYMKGKKNRL